MNWDWRWFSTHGAGSEGSYIIIDDRFDPALKGGGNYIFNSAKRKLHLKAEEKRSWTPLAVMDYSERWTVKEFEHLAQTIKDRLNAMEVEKKLKGDS